ncbi:MAG: hypothetical protein IMZ58_09595 [Thermoplasmata archaeon]|nr:hypothetical protein [Thermoplasmata archaeon]
MLIKRSNIVADDDNRVFGSNTISTAPSSERTNHICASSESNEVIE